MVYIFEDSQNKSTYILSGPKVQNFNKISIIASALALDPHNNHNLLVNVLNIV